MQETLQKLLVYKFLTCLVKCICINAFQDVGGGHLGFFNFEALLHIFELGIQQIWIHHPSISPKSLCAIN